MDESGSLKFQCNWKRNDALRAEPEFYSDLIAWRNRLYNLGLIGSDSNEIGFGNLSKRWKKNQFIISGSGTGTIKTIKDNHFTLVTGYDLDANTLDCSGPVIASSESLTHAAIYQCKDEINAIIHVHHRAMWEKYCGNLPTTPEKAEYGTQEIAREVIRLLNGIKSNKENIIIMGGHKEGIISFGKDLDEAGNLLEEYFYD